MAYRPIVYNDAAATFQVVSGATACQVIGARRLPNGLENPDLFNIAYSPSTRTLGISYGAGAAVWVDGTKVDKSGAETSLAHANISRKYYFYYTYGGVLTVSSTPWDLLAVAPLAVVYYNATLASAVIFDERHSATVGLDEGTHKYLHDTQGTQLLGGFGISGYTLNSSGASSLSYAVAAGTIADEDVLRNCAELVDDGPYRVFWRAGASGEWTWSDTSVTGIIEGGTGSSIVYNRWNGTAWVQTEITGLSKWVNYYVVVLPEISGAYRTCVVMGQVLHNSLSAATFEDPTSISGLGELAEEGVILYKMTYQRTSSSPSNARLVKVQFIGASLITVVNELALRSHSGLLDRSVSDAHPASSVAVSADVFTNVLSGLSTPTTQKALEVLDAVVIDNTDGAETKKSPSVAAMKTYVAGNSGSSSADNVSVDDSTFSKVLGSLSAPANVQKALKVLDSVVLNDTSGDETLQAPSIAAMKTYVATHGGSGGTAAEDINIDDSTFIAVLGSLPDPNAQEAFKVLDTVVLNTTSGNETLQAPSVSATKTLLGAHTGATSNAHTAGAISVNTSTFTGVLGGITPATAQNALKVLDTVVIDSTAGDETLQAPSVSAMKNYVSSHGGGGGGPIDDSGFVGVLGDLPEPTAQAAFEVLDLVVLNSTSGNQTLQAPSIAAMKSYVAAATGSRLEIPEVAGETFEANKTHVVRYSGTLSRVYKATKLTTTANGFWAIGVLQTTTEIAAGDPCVIVTIGEINLKSGDPLLSTGSAGSPLFLGDGGTFSELAPGSGLAAGTEYASCVIGNIKFRSGTPQNTVIFVRPLQYFGTDVA
jgi:hypothetical protein